MSFMTLVMSQRSKALSSPICSSPTTAAQEALGSHAQEENQALKQAGSGECWSRRGLCSGSIPPAQPGASAALCVGVAATSPSSRGSLAVSILTSRSYRSSQGLIKSASQASKTQNVPVGLSSSLLLVFVECLL